MAAEMSKNISETLKSINLKKPVLSTLAQKGSDSLVQQFLTENVQLGSEEKGTAQSQLYIASFWGFHDVVKKLVQNGTDVNWRNPNTRWTPLHAATFQEHGKIIMFLLENNANPHSNDSEGRSPADFGSASDKVWALFAACGCTRTSKLNLLEKGVLRKPAAENIKENNEVTANRDSNTMRKGTVSSLINYDNASSLKNSNTRHAYAASIDGDVLAGDIVVSGKSNREDQPTFNMWRS